MAEIPVTQVSLLARLRAISATVAALAKGTMKTMLTHQFKAGAFLLAVVFGLSAGTGIPTRQVLSARQPEPAAKSKKEAASAGPTQPSQHSQDKPGRLLFYRTGHLTLIGPDGKNEKQASKDGGEFVPTHAWLSPDGKGIAFTVQVEREPVAGRDPRRKVYVRGLDEPEPGTDLKVEGQHVCWSPDGTQLVAVECVYGDDPKDVTFVNWLVDVKTKEKTALKLPKNHEMKDWSRDGKHFLTAAHELKKKPTTARLYLMNRDGTEAETLTDGTEPVYSGRLSPDGRKLLYLAPDPERKRKDGVAGKGLFVLDIPKRKSMRLEGQPLNGEFVGFCWSPDGKRIAYAWRQVHEKKDADQDMESSLVVADADGKNPVTIATEKALVTGPIAIGAVDWR
jgi:Tol biopolymer transport system component